VKGRCPRPLDERDVGFANLVLKVLTNIEA